MKGSNNLRNSGEGSLSGGASKASKVNLYLSLIVFIRLSDDRVFFPAMLQQGYDYSKVPASFVGALPTNQAAVSKEDTGRGGSSGRGGKNSKGGQQKKGNTTKHGDTLNSANPYMFGSSVSK